MPPAAACASFSTSSTGRSGRVCRSLSSRPAARAPARRRGEGLTGVARHGQCQQLAVEVEALLEQADDLQRLVRDRGNTGAPAGPGRGAGSRRPQGDQAAAVAALDEAGAHDLGGEDGAGEEQLARARQQVVDGGRAGLVAAATSVVRASMTCCTRRRSSETACSKPSSRSTAARSSSSDLPGRRRRRRRRSPARPAGGARRPATARPAGTGRDRGRAGRVAEDLRQVVDDLLAAPARRASSARRMSVRPCSIRRT